MTQTININHTHTLKNITVKSFVANGQREWVAFKGKGTGIQIFGSRNYNDIVHFDEKFHSLVYKNIWSLKDNRKGGAYFLDGNIFDSNHPFAEEGGYSLSPR